MKTLSIRSGLILCACVAAVWLAGGGCDRKPTNPPPAEPGEHLFYVSTRLADNQSLVKTFSVEQRVFIDSFIVDNFEIIKMEVVGNDEILYLGSAKEGVRFYDIKSKKLLYETSEYCCGGSVSANAKYYEALGSGLSLFTVDGYRKILYDSHGSGAGSFSYNSGYFLYKCDSNIIVYDLRNDSIENSFQLSRNGSFFRLYRIWPTVDMKKLFLIGNQGMLLYFAVADFGGDTVRTLQAPLNTGGEDAAVSPDGRYLYFVNAPFADYEPPRMKIDVYDTETEQLITSISTREYFNFVPRHISLTSDGKYLMATPWWMGGADVLLIDPKNMNVLGSYEFGDQIIPEGVCTKH